MTTRYFKSKDGHMVCTMSSGNRSKRVPGLPHNPNDWIEIGRPEFYRLKRKILNSGINLNQLAKEKRGEK